MKEILLNIPLSESDVENLEIGDIVYLNGVFFTARTLFHKRAMSGVIPPLPFDEYNVMVHMGPMMRKVNSEWEPVSMDPTTSVRMNKYGKFIIEKLGLRGIIGKGTMSLDVQEAMKRHKCVHLSKIGIYGNVLASQVDEVIGVHYIKELGPVECTWVIKARDFGPFLVDIDTKGRNYFDEINENARRRMESIYRSFSIADDYKYTEM